MATQSSVHAPGLVGSRVCVNGADRATVRYVGAVGTSAGEWLGVEWDDPSRGKHDGTHEGVKYFECTRSGRDAPTPASFIRDSANKVSHGVTVMEALRVKYGVDISHEDQQGLFVRTVGNVAVPVQVVGFGAIAHKQSQLEKLTVVDVSEEMVARAGEDGEIARACPNIQELDIGSNLLATWEELARICRQMPRLRHLNMSKNIIDVPGALVDPVFQDAFPQVEELFLSQSGLTSLALLKPLLQWMPLVHTLHFRENRLTSTELLDAAGAFHAIKLLDLDGNLLEWSGVAPLAILPGLENLWLTNNRITKISGDDAAKFTTLKGLALEYNQIDDWATVDAIDRFPALRDLRIRHNPVMLNEDASREFTIARIGGIDILNRTAISKRQRAEAEMYTLMYIADVAPKDPVAFCSRYDALMKLYSDTMVIQPRATAKEATLKDRLLEISLRSNSLDKTLVKKLPGDLTLQKLRLLVTKLFPTLARSSIVFQFGDSGQLEDAQSLSSLGAVNGSVLVVDAQTPQ